MQKISIIICLLASIPNILAGTAKIHTLTDMDYESFIADHEMVFLKIFAPWCEISQSVNKPFSELADQYLNYNVTFAEINGDKNPKVYQHFKLQGFPGLFVFVNGTDNFLQYLGPVDQTAGIRSFLDEFVLKRNLPDYKEERVEQLSKGENYVGFGLYCGERNSNEYIKVAYASMLIPNLVIFYSNSTEICSKYSIKANQLAYQRISGNVVYLKALGDLATLKRQMKFIKFDPVNPFLLDFFTDAIEGRFPMLIYIDPSSNHTMIPHLHALHNKKLMYNMLTMHNKMQSSFEIEYFPLLGIKKSELPALIILIFSKKFIKYKYEGDGSYESLEQFVNDFYASKLIPHLASEDTEETDSDLQIITARSMYSFILNPSKFKILLFYTPSCAGCDEIKRITKDVARHFQNEQDMDFGVIDISKNEVPNIKEAPMLALFAKEPEQEPTFYKGPVDFEKIKTFILDKTNVQPTTSEL